MTQHAVYITLGGAERSLRLQLGAWAALKDRGHDIQALLTDWQKDVTDYRTLQLLLWGMLQNGPEPRAMMEDVGDWVDADNLPTVLQAMGECLRASFPTKNGNGAGPPAKAARGTGTKRAAQPSVPSD